jgi:hypothetical protein
MLLLIRPEAFGFNHETASSNTFQQRSASATSAAAAAQAESDAMCAQLTAAGIPFKVIADTTEPIKPDAVFPNNWISFHDGKTIVLWPMQAPNRRLERRSDIVQQMQKEFGYTEVFDFSHHENEGRFLEGTGSLVIDYENRIAYAALSPRTDPGLVRTACRHLNYKPVSFRTVPQNGQAVYHTNVVMALHPQLAVVCTEVILPDDRKMVLTMLRESGHELLEISIKQMNAFAGNMLFVKNSSNNWCCVLSETARNSFTPEQLARLEKYAKPVPCTIPVIETIGGGSARCMLAEVR